MPEDTCAVGEPWNEPPPYAVIRCTYNNELLVAIVKGEHELALAILEYEKHSRWIKVYK